MAETYDLPTVQKWMVVGSALRRLILGRGKAWHSVWLLNENIETLSTLAYNLNFVSNGVSYKRIYRFSNSSSGLSVLNYVRSDGSGTDNAHVYDAGTTTFEQGWQNEAYRTIYCITDPKEAGDFFYAWLTTNATKIG